MNRLSRAVQNQFNDKKEREDIRNLTLSSERAYYKLRGAGMGHEEALEELSNKALSNKGETNNG
jgi:hypothetical protein